MDESNNMKIAGSGTIPTGEYNEIKISGSGSITGDVKANIIKISGSGESRCNIISNEMRVSGSFDTRSNMNINELLKINGSLDCKGNIKANDIKINGSLGCSSNISANNMKVNGGSYVKGDVSFDTLEIRGIIDVEGNCEGREFLGYGGAKVKGLLSADKITIITNRDSFIKEIGGEDIVIKKREDKKLSFIFFNPFSRGRVETDCIEGDNIFVENTICKILRGNNITVGEGCRIGRIEYLGELTVDEKSEVGERVCMKN